MLPVKHRFRNRRRRRSNPSAPYFHKQQHRAALATRACNSAGDINVKCKFCGCTDLQACQGGCYWIAPKICSQCKDRIKERPILFSAPMVRAILEGRKTQTRRVVKDSAWRDFGDCDLDGKLVSSWGIDKELSAYGNPGDRLWVRETFLIGYESDGNGNLIHFDANGNELSPKAFYRATSPDLEWMNDDGYHVDATPWKPSIFMPRWASRITLEVIDVRVQRLQEISEADAIAEGCEQGLTSADADYEVVKRAVNALGVYSAVARYSLLWDSINAKRAPWSSNPWVWAITFKRLAP
jgi:hypothetical protein